MCMAAFTNQANAAVHAACSERGEGASHQQAASKSIGFLTFFFQVYEFTVNITRNVLCSTLLGGRTVVYRGYGV